MRELRNVLERAALLADGTQITAEHVQQALGTAGSVRVAAAPVEQRAGPSTTTLRSVDPDRPA